MKPFDPQPTLLGANYTLRPLRAEDFDALATAASDPLIWAVHPDPTRWQRAVFEERFFAPALKDRAALVVVENASGALVGSSRYYDLKLAANEVAIGFTFLVRRLWGGAANREIKRLMLDHAFQSMERVWFHIGAANGRSRRAMEKIGGELHHLADRPVNGVPTHYAYYVIERAKMAQHVHASRL